MSFQKLLLLTLAGGLGALARYGLAGVAQNFSGRLFPWGTATVNVLGCLAFGIVWTVMQERWPVSGETRAVVLVGFLGAFTTFSTFAFETSQFLRDAQWLAACGNVALHNVLGLAAMIVGVALGRLI